MSSKTTANPPKIGILTISDRASAGIYDDKSGAAIRETLGEWLLGEIAYEMLIIPDDLAIIAQTLRDLSGRCDIVFTTGGTGPAPRDVTPEATATVCEKMLPGFGELMRAESLKFVPTAILSRQTAGICGRCLIVNLPGQPKAIRECLTPIFPAIPYCVDLIGGAYFETDETKIKAFRPKKS